MKLLIFSNSVRLAERGELCVRVRIRVGCAFAKILRCSCWWCKTQIDSSSVIVVVFSNTVSKTPYNVLSKLRCDHQAFLSVHVSTSWLLSAMRNILFRKKGTDNSELLIPPQYIARLELRAGCPQSPSLHVVRTSPPLLLPSPYRTARGFSLFLSMLRTRTL